MAISRRQFLKRSGLVGAGTLLGPGLFGNGLMQQAYAALEANGELARSLGASAKEFRKGISDGSETDEKTDAHLNQPD